MLRTSNAPMVPPCAMAWAPLQLDAVILRKRVLLLALLSLARDHRYLGMLRDAAAFAQQLGQLWVDSKHGLEQYIWRDGTEDVNAAALVEYRVTVYTSDIRYVLETKLRATINLIDCRLIYPSAPGTSGI
eukprot:scaffold70268_cov22-Tisochrysis_lutea.AAC.1